MQLDLSNTQKQILSGKQIQSVEILQMTMAELDAYVENLAIENPMLDLTDHHEEQEWIGEDISGKEYDRQKQRWLESDDYQNKSYYSEEPFLPGFENRVEDTYSSEETLFSCLHDQIVGLHIPETEKEILDYMAQLLDEGGYFRENLVLVQDKYHISETYALNMLHLLQLLEPAGVAARDLRECLLLQAERKKDSCVYTDVIIRDHLNDLAKNHLDKICRSTKAAREEICRAAEEIRRMDPKPGARFGNRESIIPVRPDVRIFSREGHQEIMLRESRYAHLSPDPFYQQMQQSTDDPEIKKYLSEKLQQIQWVESCIEQRQTTLKKVLQVLTEIQFDFFAKEKGTLHPMRLSDIADRLGIHESTVSRALQNKYLQCERGVFPLHYFLTAAVSKNEESKEALTVRQIKQKIQEIIDAEDRRKPYSDQMISQKLQEEGISISRRTVSKYRVEMCIPDKGGRK